MLQWFGLTQFSFFLGRICLSNRFPFGRSEFLFFFLFLFFFPCFRDDKHEAYKHHCGKKCYPVLDIATDITSIFPQRQGRAWCDRNMEQS